MIDARHSDAAGPSRRLAYAQRYRAEKRQRIAEYKAAKGCERCAESDPRCLDFHHRDPAQKSYTISRLYRGTWSWARVLEEIEKCSVLCANCHRKEHSVAVI